MKPGDLSLVGAGFSNEAFGSQTVFRAALHALSHPGQPVSLLHDAEVPRHGHAASAVLLLALLDADCTLWLSPTLMASNAAPWLRFHTGCQLVQEPAQAQFAWVSSAAEMPVLNSFSSGSDAYPDRSTTCVLDVPDFTGNAGNWYLSGPGIQDSVSLQVTGISQEFSDQLAAQWIDNHASFPRGVDLFLAAPTQIVGLPRSTRIHPTAKA